MSEQQQQCRDWISSYSGFDGGDTRTVPGEGYWFCGIEYGTGCDPAKVDLTPVSSPDMIKSWPKDKVLTWLKPQYNTRTAKLYACLTQGDHRGYTAALKDYKKIANPGRDQAGLFTQHSKMLKLNLYPIPFKKSSHQLWNSAWAEVTGFQQKQAYMEFCRKHRFPLLARLAQVKIPKLIVCTGKTFKSSFLEAFTGSSQGASDTLSGTVCTGDGRHFYYRWLNDKQTLLVISYFLGGRYGCSSDQHLQNLAININKVMSQRSIGGR